MTQRPIDAAVKAIDEMTHHLSAIMVVLSNPVNLSDNQRLVLIERVTGLQATAVNGIRQVLIDHEGQLAMLQEQVDTIGAAVFPEPEQPPTEPTEAELDAAGERAVQEYRAAHPEDGIAPARDLKREYDENVIA